MILGLGLIVFAATLAINARKQQVKLSDAWIAVLMDLGWVLGSYVLIFAAPFSTGGKWVVGAVAELVLLFAVLQFLGIRRIRRTEQLGWSWNVRDLAARARYFHNGSADNLNDVVTFYHKRFGIGFTANGTLPRRFAL